MWKSEYTILPDYSPLYPQVPYHYKNYHKISVYCRGHRDAIEKFLPSNFEYVSDVFEIFVLKNDEIKGLEPYSEGGIVIPCKYKNRVGAYMAYEYVDTDEALCAGREIWGYPKKLAEVRYQEKSGEIHGKVIRKGKTIIDISLTLDDTEVNPPVLFPRLQVKRMPRADQYGTDMDQVILNEFADSVIHTRKQGTATVNWEHSSFDPLAELGPLEVLGGVFVIGDFTLTYGRVIDQVVQSVNK
ncbi:acetoacetate decarboxylase family protein [Metabacillus arenae]|uniref:Acetoacetate decarboxylase family protein n=1 Tax=Metabacillus arenae TaxID=2771434 RepID=A0A926RYA4_9BACI|nr:acetoacetate decarboxylase family protein [Metabacillus arenae]MBD1381515.1 acetoacetate decarboxylase family protein [Metabacillus arenae]